MRYSLTPTMADALIAAREQRFAIDEAAFLELYARTTGPLGGYLRRLTGNPALAEDLLQDAYLRFLSRLRVPEGEDHQRHSLFRIATNLARDEFRRRRCEHAWRERTPAVEAVPPDTGGEGVWELLAHVSPRDRELLLLAYVEGMTHKEIAGVTGLVTASVRPLLFRARRRFAAVLRAAGFDAEVRS